MFQTYAFTEMPYPYARLGRELDSAKFGVPNALLEPELGAMLVSKYLDIFQAADELGLNIMCNEHHGSASCTNSTLPLYLAVIAHSTKNARLLALGNPVGNRTEPIRVAEEMAAIDMMSRGRLEAGLVRGSPEECITTNAHPIFQRERYWEAIDLIVKAWTTHDGPFSWEGKYFQHREVNIWPRPYTQPHPPVWITTLTAPSAPQIADRGYVVATIMNGMGPCREIFDTYRARHLEVHGVPAELDRFAYTASVLVADSDEIAYEESKKLQWHYHDIVQPNQFFDVPGYMPTPVRAKIMAREFAELAAGRELKLSYDGIRQRLCFDTVPNLARDGFFFAGNPDTVFEQLRAFYYAVGGFGHLIGAVQSEFMSNQVATRSMELLSREVLPRFHGEVYLPSLAERDEIGRVVQPMAAAV